jgi:hypothetical protein
MQKKLSRIVWTIVEHQSDGCLEIQHSALDKDHGQFLAESRSRAIQSASFDCVTHVECEVFTIRTSNCRHGMIIEKFDFPGRLSQFPDHPLL